MNDWAIQVVELSKSHSQVKLVDNVSFQVAAGQVVGFVGRNGAGKTTTLRCLLGLMKADGGDVKIFNQSPQSACSNYLVGWIPEQPILFEYLTARENLNVFNSQATTEEIDKWLFKTGLADASNKQVRYFSKGMKQRLCLAGALMTSAPLLVLDEPFSGLDFVGRKYMREVLLAEKAAGRTIFFSSHHFEDIHALCDEFILIHHGRVLQQEKVSKESLQHLENIPCSN